MGKELGIEGPKVKLHIYSLRKTFKNTKLQNAWHDGIHGLSFKKFTSNHDRLALEINRCLQEGDIPEWMTKWKTKKSLSKEQPQATTNP